MEGDQDPIQVGQFVMDKIIGIGAFGNIRASPLWMFVIEMHFLNCPTINLSNNSSSSLSMISNPFLKRWSKLSNKFIVKLATHAVTGHKVAIKILSKDKIKQWKMERIVEREVENLQSCAHPHILRLFDVVETPTSMFLVNEYVSEAGLFDYLNLEGRLIPDEARHFFHQIISAIEYCHLRKIVHRDVKLENLWLDANCNIKLACFGLSMSMKDCEFLRTSCGSPNYAAPEVIIGKQYGPEVDVWSCGVILYALLCGSLPFHDESIPNLFMKIKSGTYSLPTHLSQLAKTLIPQILEVDPTKRIAIAEIRMHPWFQHQLPQYLRLPPELERVVDQDVVDLVMELPFHNEFGSTILNYAASARSNGPVHPVVLLPTGTISRQKVENAASLRDCRDSDAPQIVIDLRCVYELILEDKQTRIRAMEAALAIGEATSATSKESLNNLPATNLNK